MTFIIIFIVVILVIIIGSLIGTANNIENKGEILAQIESSLPNFKITNKTCNFEKDWEIAIDDVQRKFCYINSETSTYTIYSYDDVISFEIIRDGVSVSSKSTTNTIGRAIVGGVVAGGVGAIIGGTTSKTNTIERINNLTVKIHLRSMERPTLDLIIAKDAALEDDLANMALEEARNVMDIFAVIVDDVNRNSSKEQEDVVHSQSLPENQPSSTAYELERYADLRERGIITYDEFQVLKAKLIE